MGAEGDRLSFASCCGRKTMRIMELSGRARMQFLNVVLVAAGFMNSQYCEDVKATLREDFEISDRLGVTFQRLSRWMLSASFLVAPLHTFGDATSSVKQHHTPSR